MDELEYTRHQHNQRDIQRETRRRPRPMDRVDLIAIASYRACRNTVSLVSSSFNFLPSTKVPRLHSGFRRRLRTI